MQTTCIPAVLMVGIILAWAPVTLGGSPTWSHDPYAGFDAGDALRLAQVSQSSDHPAKHIQAQPLVGREIANRVSYVTSYRTRHGLTHYSHDHSVAATTYNDAVFAPPSEEDPVAATRPRSDTNPAHSSVTSSDGMVSVLRSTTEYYPVTNIAVAHRTDYHNYRHCDGGYHFRRHAYWYRPHYDGGSFYYGRQYYGHNGHHFGHSGFGLRYGHHGGSGLSIHFSF